MNREQIDAIAYSGDLYDPNIPAVVLYQERVKRWIARYNKLGTSLVATARKVRLIKKIFGAIGKESWVEPPLHANFGGRHVFVGDHFYANSNLTLVDDGRITIGNHVMFGPNVTLVTATHPVSPDLRKSNVQYNKPIVIEDGVWLGAGVTVLPGVTIGRDSVVGAGSLVTKDVPEGVVAYGVPCEVRRPISSEDYVTFDHGRPIPQEVLDRYAKK